jgi:hypothetical protein
MPRPLFTAALLAFATTLTFAATPAPPPGGAPSAPRLREGEAVELAGRMELSGDRAIFHSDAGHPPLRLLENLALERIARILGESSEERVWVVSGVITEYRGANYLLVTKAVQRAKK